MATLWWYVSQGGCSTMALLPYVELSVLGPIDLDIGI